MRFFSVRTLCLAGIALLSATSASANPLATAEMQAIDERVCDKFIFDTVEMYCPPILQCVTEPCTDVPNPICLAASAPYLACKTAFTTSAKVRQVITQELGYSRVVSGTDQVCSAGGKLPTAFCVRSDLEIYVNYRTGLGAFICSAATTSGVGTNVGLTCGAPGSTPATAGGPEATAAYGVFPLASGRIDVNYSGIGAGTTVRGGYSRGWPLTP